MWGRGSGSRPGLCSVGSYWARQVALWRQDPRARSGRPASWHRSPGQASVASRHTGEALGAGGSGCRPPPPSETGSWPSGPQGGGHGGATWNVPGPVPHVLREPCSCLATWACLAPGILTPGGAGGPWAATDRGLQGRADRGGSPSPRGTSCHGHGCAAASPSPGAVCGHAPECPGVSDSQNPYPGPGDRAPQAGAGPALQVSVGTPGQTAAQGTGGCSPPPPHFSSLSPFSPNFPSVIQSPRMEFAPDGVRQALALGGSTQGLQDAPGCEPQAAGHPRLPGRRRRP